MLGLQNSASVSAGTYGYTTSAAHSINDAVTAIDYKLSEKSQQDILSLMQYSYLSKIEADESDKYVITSTSRDLVNGTNSYQDTNEDSEKSELSDVAVAKSYLINNNILSRKEVVTYDSSTGMWSATRYEDVKLRWNKMFTTKYNKCLNSVDTDSPKISKVENAFENYVDAVLSDTGSGGLITLMKEAKMLTDDQLSEIEEETKEITADLDYRLGKTSSENYHDELESSMEEFKELMEMHYDNMVVADSDKVRKSDLLMLLYKSVWGSIQSRPIVFNKTAVRNANTYSESTGTWWEDGKLITKLNKYYTTTDGHKVVRDYWDTTKRKDNADFTSGDYYYYVSNNVYELYFKALLDKGIIYKNEFRSDNEDSGNLFGETDSPGRAFTSAINKLSKGTTPVWWNESGLCDSNVSQALGQSIKYTKGGTITARNPKYFNSESITYGEALEYIEDVLRISEDDITDTEADIITYKYGITYLSAYTEKQQKTLSFLISKGILSFEDGDQYSDLDSRVTYAKLYQLLYRVANEDARYDFSKITLTDGESFWQSNGYGANDLAVYSVAAGFTQDEGSVEKSGSSDSVTTVAQVSIGELSLMSLASFSKQAIDVPIALAADTSSYLVTKRLAKSIAWKYGTTKLSDIVNGGDKPSDIKSIKVTNTKFNGSSVPCYKVVFSVKAGSAAGALKKVEKNLKCPVDANTKKLTAVTKVKKAGSADPTYTMVSQSSMKQTWSNISVIEDKVLVNTVTGAQAVILPDSGYALVGNTVILTKDEFLMTDTDESGEVYYNMKIIQSILEDSFQQKLGTGAIVTNSDTVADYKAVVRSEYDANFGKAVVTNFTLTKKFAKLANGDLVSTDDGKSEEEDSTYSKGQTLYMYNVNSVTEGINTIVKDFKCSLGGKTKTLTLVIDWKFAIPAVEDFESVSDLYDAITTGDSDNTLQTELYTRPTNSKILENWWDSNYMASNMLCNYVYGTTGVCYVNTGYLVPSISILMPSSCSSSHIKWINTMFNRKSDPLKAQTWDSNGTSSNESLLAAYFGDDIKTWYQKFFSPTEAFADMDLTEEEASILQSMVTDYRTVSFCYGKDKSNGDGTFYASWAGNSVDQHYFRTASGVVYRDLDSDTRVVYNLNSKGKVSLIKMKTRTTSQASLNAGSTTVTYNANGTNHKMLYVGTKTISTKKKKKTVEQTYLLFVPYDKPIVRDTTSELYNGGKLLWSGGDGTAVYPKFVPYKNKQLTTSKIDYGYSDVWDAWAQEYLGTKTHPYHFDYNYAFHFSNQDTLYGFTLRNLSCVGKNTVIYDYDTSARNKIVNKKPTNRNTLYEALNFFGLKLRAKTNKEHSNTVYSKKNTDKNKLATREELQNMSAPDSSLRVNAIGSSTSDDKKTIYGVPVFYLSVDEWTVYTEDSTTTGASSGTTTDNDCMLSHHKKSSAICFGNYYPYSITKSLQESIIANYVQTTNLSELNAGDMITIGDIRFFVDSDSKQDDSSNKWLTSVAVRSIGARKGLRNYAAKWTNKAKDEKGFKSVVKSTFKDLVVLCDGRAYPFTNYIKDKGKKGSSSGIQVGPLRNTKNTRKYGLIYTENNKAYGYKKKKSKQKVSGTEVGRYAMTTIRLKLDGKLKVRPINSEKTIYTLTSTTASGNYGTGDDLPSFYTESLSYEDDQYADISVSSSRYNPSIAFTNAKNKFVRNYQKALAGDFKSLFLMVITCIAAYLVVMSWIAYLAIHHAGLRILLEALAAGPNRSAQRGFDLIKFLTFGIYSLDDDPPLARVCAIMLMCTLVMLVAINFN